MKKRTVVIVGGGSAGLMAASMLSPHLKVMVYEKERLVGRKFLVAGDGGFNLTNDVAREDLVQKYEPFDFMKKTLEVADSDCMRLWLAGIGVQTYTGSSGRVFPLQLKPHGVLKALKNSITENNGEIYTNHPLVDLDDSGNPVVYDVVNQNFLRPVADVCIYALGGASWPKTGSDGNWISIFAKAGIKTIPFQASNCGVEILWPAALMDQFEGLPIKNAAFTCGNLRYHGEATLTRYGLEGSAIYPLIPMVRRAILDAGVAELFIDFKPMQTHEVLLKKISNPGGTKLYAKSLNLTSLQLQLVKNGLTKPQFQNPDFFVNSLKNFRLQISGLRDIHEAISSVGGFPVAQIDSNWQVKGWSSKYVIGEMVDWDAPTGGFLLQGCFASALKVVRHILS